MNRLETIFSLSSAPGRAGVAVIRISGPSADAALLALCGRLPEIRIATVMTVRDPSDERVLDRGLVLRFARGASFTGEASAELQVHGGRAVVKAILSALGRLPGLRLAEAGEFTRRALENCRLDLGQVEALADLIDAETEMQRRQAVRGLEGLLGQRVGEWRRLLLDALALVAAEIDFSDEGDVGDSVADGIASLLEQLQAALESALKGVTHGRLVAEGFRVAIVGPPNVGKSTLLNVLAGSEIAIVTEHAGTTRDVLEVRLDVGGYAVVLFDTAGMREALDPVEIIGVQRARQVAATSDLLLILDDGRGMSSDVDWGDTPSIRVRTKCDEAGFVAAGFDVAISARTRVGIDSLLKRILQHLEASAGSEVGLVTRERQRVALQKALVYCREARSARLLGVEFVDQNLRRVDAALAEVVGAIGVEDVLGAIFTRFCVGK